MISKGSNMLSRAEEVIAADIREAVEVVNDGWCCGNKLEAVEAR